MDQPALVLALLVFATVGVLPRIFFRRDGKLNLAWWLTAWPYTAVPVLLVLSASHVFAPEEPRGWAGGLAIAATVFFFLSVALLFYTLGTHRIRISLWHQDNDAPANIVTYGAYQVARHPFYLSFLLALVGSLLLLPHWSVALVLVYAAARMNSTAAREEKRLSSGAFGPEYRAYMATTGRFYPRLGRPALAAATVRAPDQDGVRI